MEGPRRSWLRVLAPIALGVLLLAALALALGDLREFLDRLAEIRPRPLALALAFVALSYLFFHATIAAYAHAAGVPFPAVRAAPASWVSQAVNNVLSAGGATGIALRVAGYARHGVSPGRAAALSVMATLAGDFLTVLGILAGVAIVSLQGRVPRSALGWSGGLLVLALAAWIVLHAVLRDPARRATAGGRLARLVARMAARLPERLRGSGAAIERFNAEAGTTIGAVLARPSRAVLPAALASCDLLARGAALWAAFAAVGHPLPVPVALTGFLVGLGAGMLSLIPGGLGAVEGSMSAVFVWMGVPLPVAAAAAVVFRFVYYVAPLAPALLLSRVALGSPRRNG